MTDFTDTMLTVTLTTVLTSPFWTSGSFNGIIFTSPGSLGLTGASVDPATTMAGFDDSRVSFTSDQILVNWNGLSYDDGTVVKIDFAFAPISEPASLALLGTALAGMAMARRRRIGAPTRPGLALRLPAGPRDFGAAGGEATVASVPCRLVDFL